MSLFSYLASYKEHKNFKEPELLGTMIKRVVPGMEPKAAEATGWSMHLLAGYTFAFVYAQILERSGMKPTIGNGILMGTVSGIPAVMIWYSMFKLHPNPPKKRYESYFLHLIAAHAIFGAYTFAGFKKEKNAVA